MRARQSASRTMKQSSESKNHSRPKTQTLLLKVTVTSDLQPRGKWVGQTLEVSLSLPPPADGVTRKQKAVLTGCVNNQ